MAVKGNIEKREEVYYQRCNSRMVFERFHGPGDILFGWRCLIYGDILDPAGQKGDEKGQSKEQRVPFVPEGTATLRNG